MIGRFPCRIGTCTTPIEVSLSLLYANGVVPGGLVKALLYPGAIAKAIYKNNAIPSYGKLLEAYKFNNMKESPATHDLQNLEVIIGSYLSVAGALLGLMKSGRFSLTGILLITWGLDKQVLFRNYTTAVGGFLHLLQISCYTSVFHLEGKSRFFQEFKNSVSGIESWAELCREE
ncbi:hypothetical protein K7X08_034640 [Anisodus acutangulus]|uniref:Uncharacterized protein n=1 Tax=Anisodus acutangulus TaxID=402998 RepID=A0A9Q1LJN5_9SOLA|nr:hypothetical protein K7X08_034640 [Anisodus acutangulus]